MKKILITTLLAVMALAATSCSNEPDPTPNGDKAPIAFGDVATRAAVTSADEILSFGVFAQMNLGNEATQEGYDQYINLLENEEVSRATASEEWDYDNTRYWVDNRVFRFYSYYPLESDATNNHYGAISGVTNEGMTDGFKLTFTTPDAADQDLLVAQNTYATAVKGENGYSYPTVEVDFQHALTNVRIVLDYDTTNNKYDDFEIQEFSLSNIKKVGALTCSYSSSSVFGSWNIDQLQNMNFSWTDADGVSLREDCSDGWLAPWSDGLILLPQTVGVNAVSVKIKYLYDAGNLYDDDPGTEDPDTETRVSREINTYLPPITWQPNVTYTYRMTLHEDNLLTFKSIDILSWGELQQGGAIIIK